MYTIKTLNNISDIIYSSLKDPEYTVTSNGGACDAYLVRSADMHEMALDKGTLAIARAGAGVNNIPVDSCAEKGIVVFNTPGANANAVKELVMCGLLLSARKVVPGIEWVKEQHEAGVSDIPKLMEKAKKQFVGPELAGKKLGIIGLGAVGVMVANGASNGLDMEVVGYDPYISVEAAWHLTRKVKQSTSLGDIFETCDYITLHLPLSEKTKNMVGQSQLDSIKRGAVLLNFARGGLVDSEAVCAALDNGQISRYVTDFPDDILAGHDGVIAFPHLGASTPESEENCAMMAARQLRDYLADGNIRNSVNLPECVLPRSGASRLAIINRNITNMVGQIAAVLASESNNIEHMVNKSRGQWAYTLIDLADRPSDACVERIKSIDGVIKVRAL